MKKYEKALEVKDRMLWEVIQGHKALEEKLGDETKLCAEYGEEMANWLALTDRLSREVNQLRQLSSHTGVLEQDYETLLSDFEEAKREVSG